MSFVFWCHFPGGLIYRGGAYSSADQEEEEMEATGEEEEEEAESEAEDTEVSCSYFLTVREVWG